MTWLSLLKHWKVAVLALALAAAAVQTKRLESAKAEFNQFKGGVSALAEAAKAQAALRELQDLRNKERADEEHDRRMRAHRAAVAELRHQRDSARGAFLSKAPAGSVCPAGQTCLDTAEYLRAHGALVAGVRGLADECSKVAEELRTAQEWAQNGN